MVLDLQRSCKDSTESSLVPLKQFQFSLMLRSYSIMVHLSKIEDQIGKWLLTLDFISPVFPLMSFPIPGSNLGYYIPFICHVSLVSSVPWQFLSLSLFFTTLTVWGVLARYFVECKKKCCALKWGLILSYLGETAFCLGRPGKNHGRLWGRKDIEEDTRPPPTLVFCSGDEEHLRTTGCPVYLRATPRVNGLTRYTSQSLVELLKILRTHTRPIKSEFLETWSRPGYFFSFFKIFIGV